MVSHPSAVPRVAGSNPGLSMRRENVCAIRNGCHGRTDGPIWMIFGMMLVSVPMLLYAKGEVIMILYLGVMDVTVTSFAI